MTIPATPHALYPELYRIAELAHKGVDDDYIRDECDDVARRYTASCLTGADILDGSIEGADISSVTSLEIDSLFTTGNVGIGTTGPTERLQVDGNLKVTGALKNEKC